MSVYTRLQHCVRNFARAVAVAVVVVAVTVRYTVANAASVHGRERRSATTDWRYRDLDRPPSRGASQAGSGSHRGGERAAVHSGSTARGRKLLPRGARSLGPAQRSQICLRSAGTPMGCTESVAVKQTGGDELLLVVPNSSPRGTRHQKSD